MTLDQRAKQAREQLFKRYDALNALWLKAEEEITKLHIPHSVTYAYDSLDTDEFGLNEGKVFFVPCLGVQKIKGKWRICVGSYYDYPDGRDSDPEWTSIIECSAEIRVEAAEHLPGLRQKVVEEAEKFIPRVNKAIEALEKALAADNNMEALLAERAMLNGRAKS
jgi:hypothetical protein